LRRLGGKFAEAADIIEEDGVNGKLWNKMDKANPLALNPLLQD